jgi:hypothetical protein
MQGNLMITKIKDLQNVAVPTMDIMVRYIITFPWGENGVGVETLSGTEKNNWLLVRHNPCHMSNRNPLRHREK